ncbi:MAG: response regulator [Nitrospinae bacterium]|nr:response regulator [Nitrospinota bacterium]
MQKVLIVDDDPNISLLVRMTLARKKEYKIATAGSGKEALEKVAADQPDIILLDIMMPDMDGFEVCRRLKKEDKTRFIPIIMISAKTELGDKLQGMDVGANDYITKPFNPEELLARVAAHLRIKSLEDELSAKKELEAALKMSVTLQHEINNPLTGIIGNLEFLKNWKELKPGEVDETVNDVLNLSMRVKEIVKQLSKISKVVPATYVKGSEMIDLEKSGENGGK